MLPVAPSTLSLNSPFEAPLPPMKPSQSPWRGPISAVYGGTSLCGPPYLSRVGATVVVAAGGVAGAVCAPIAGGGGTVVGPVVGPCAQAAEADKATKEMPTAIFFISLSFWMCVAPGMNAPIQLGKAAMTTIVPNADRGSR